MSGESINKTSKKNVGQDARSDAASKADSKTTQKKSHKTQLQEKSLTVDDTKSSDDNLYSSQLSTPPDIPAPQGDVTGLDLSKVNTGNPMAVMMVLQALVGKGFETSSKNMEELIKVIQEKQTQEVDQQVNELQKSIEQQSSTSKLQGFLGKLGFIGNIISFAISTVILVASLVVIASSVLDAGASLAAGIPMLLVAIAGFGLAVDGVTGNHLMGALTAGAADVLEFFGVPEEYAEPIAAIYVAITIAVVMFIVTLGAGSAESATTIAEGVSDAANTAAKAGANATDAANATESTAATATGAAAKTDEVGEAAEGAEAAEPGAEETAPAAKTGANFVKTNTEAAEGVAENAQTQSANQSFITNVISKLMRAMKPATVEAASTAGKTTEDIEQGTQDTTKAVTKASEPDPQSGNQSGDQSGSSGTKKFDLLSKYKNFFETTEQRMKFVEQVAKAIQGTVMGTGTIVVGDKKYELNKMNAKLTLVKGTLKLTESQIQSVGDAFKFTMTSWQTFMKTIADTISNYGEAQRSVASAARRS